MTEHDRQIAAIRKLILAGMKMINEGQVLAKENRAQIKALPHSAKRTGC